MKKLLVRLLIAVVVVSIAFIGIGCKATATTETTATAETTAAATTAAAETTAAAKTTAAPGSLIGVSMRSIKGDFAIAIADGATETVEAAGYKISVQDAKEDSNTQLQQIEALISSGMVGFIGEAQDSKAIIPAIEKLNAANIPNYWIDVLPEGGKIDLFVSFDNVSAGKKSGEAMEKALIAKYGDSPKGVIIEIGGDLKQLDAAGGRHNGFNEIINKSKYPDITVVYKPIDNWDPNTAFQVTTDLLNANKGNVIGITCAADYTLPGVLSAMEGAKVLVPMSDPNHIVLTSIDANTGLDAIRKGLLDGDVLQAADWYGILSARYLIKDLAGEKYEFKDGEVITEEGAIWSPATIKITGVGPVMSISGAVVPLDISVDSMDLYTNKLAAKK